MWVLWARRVDVCDHNWNGRNWLIKALHELALLFVNLFHLCCPKMLCDLIQILFRTVKKSNADVGLLQRSYIVCSIAAH